MYLGLQVKWNQFSSNNSGHTSAFKLRWSRWYTCNSSFYHYQIGSIFPWLCSWGGCTMICFPLLLCNHITCANEYNIAWWWYSVVCPFYNLIIIIMQTHLELFNFDNACQVNSVNSLHSWYVWDSVLSFTIPFVMTVRIRECYLIIIIKSEVWTICHCL